MAQADECVFGDVPEDIDEHSRFGILIGGMATMSSDLDIAHSYIDAAELLLADALKNGDGWRAQYPLLLLYRHALELYLKAIIQPETLDHRLEPLITALDQLLRSRLNTQLPADLKRELLALSTLDPIGESFRYTHSRNGKPWLRGEGEFWIPLDKLQDFMRRVFHGLDNVLSALNQ